MTKISEKILLEVNASTTPMPAKVNTTIPLTQVSNSFDDSSRNSLIAMSTSTVSQVGSSNKF